MAGRRRSDRALRPVLQRSPGRPGVAQRENRRRFWAAITAGLSSEGAAIGAGVSQPVGFRWFREAGGMPPKTLGPSSKPLSERYLSLAEREGIALLRAQGCGVRETARRLGGARRRSRVNCAATRRHAAATWSTGRRPRNGMPSGRRAAQSRRSWR